jgi:hypothetical protein
MRISEKLVQDAFDYLLEQPDNAAKARAERLYMEDYTKVVKAELMSECNSEKLGEQERYAYAHPKFKAHLENLKTAIARDEKHRFTLNAKNAILDGWRTIEASNRALSKIG